MPAYRQINYSLIKFHYPLNASDIDLFILSQEPEEAKKIIASIKARQKIQSVIKTPSELADFKEKEKTYYAEVDRGITLWEKKE